MAERVGFPQKHVTVFTLLCLLIVLAGQAHAYSSEDKIARFKEWIREQKIELTDIDWPHEFNKSGRGVIARRHIGWRETLMRVPLEACIYPQMYLGTELHPLLSRMDNFHGLIWSLLFERTKKDSKFIPFMDIIPETFSTPETWTIEELDELQDDTLKQYALSRKKEMRELYNEGMDILFQNNIAIPEEVTFSLYAWSHRAVRTRCFEVNATFDHVLVPFADLLNHLETSPTIWKEENGKFVMIGGPFNFGEEVFGNYRGDFTNFHMISGYGFMRFGNKLNSERLYFPEDTLNFQKKKRMIGDRDFIMMHHDIIPLDISWFFRFLRSANPKDQMFSPQSARGERAASELCISTMARILRAKPTTIAQDYALLHALREPFSNRKSAIQYRISQKQVFWRIKEYCEILKTEVISCLTSRAVTSPYFARQQIRIASMFWEGHLA